MQLDFLLMFFDFYIDKNGFEDDFSGLKMGKCSF
jgi:hypothetical protein